MEPLVSILIPAYNAEAWIDETIRSALVQTWPRKEIIIVDDGSRDNTLSAARRHEGPLVKVVSQANEGASVARNKALSLCQGDYVQWLDADDLLAPDKVEKQMEAAVREDSKLLLSSGWAHFLYRHSRAKFHPTALWGDLSPLEWLLRKMGRNLHMQPASWLVSRALTEAAGPWDTRLTLDDDGEYFCRVLLKSSGVRFVEGARSFYRMSGPSSLSNVDRTNKKLDSLFLSMRLHLRYLRSLETSDRTREACLFYIRTWFPSFVPHRQDIMRELREIARDLGGTLEGGAGFGTPEATAAVDGKAWIRSFRSWARKHKYSLARNWDWLLYRLVGS